MEKLVNYVKNGKGIGLLFLLASATIVTLLFVMVFRNFYSSFSPEMLKAADELLPITVKNGQIVNPADTYKEIGVNLMVGDAVGDEKFGIFVKNKQSVFAQSGAGHMNMQLTDEGIRMSASEKKTVSDNDGAEHMNMQIDDAGVRISALDSDETEHVNIEINDEKVSMELFPIVLDTQSENISIKQDKQGVYIFKKAAYVVSPGQIRSFTYKDGVLDKETFAQVLNRVYETVSTTVMFVVLVVFFLMFLLKTCLVALLGLPIAALMGKSLYFPYKVLMRLASVTIAVLEGYSWIDVLYFHSSVTGRQVFWLALIFEVIVIASVKKTEEQ